jgi:predicted N-formylglutamate amidohydrolase
MINRGEAIRVFLLYFFMNPYTLNTRLYSPILLTCEHASGRIPKRFGKLGLTIAELNGAKDLYDPGSLELARKMAQLLNCSLLTSNVSRLVIDYNRRLDMKGVAKNTYHAPALKLELLTEIKGAETRVPIPMNHRERASAKMRYHTYVEPYKNAGVKLATKLAQLHGTCIVFSVHSFYPLYNGSVRTVDVDIMFDVAKKLGTRIARAAAGLTTLRVATNKPWGMKDADGGVFNALQFNSQTQVLASDVNNRLLTNVTSIREIASVLAQSIKIGLSK